MNWKRAGVILVSLGVTATVCYVSYSLVFKGNKKDFEKLKNDSLKSEIFKNLDSETELKMIKNIHNLSKKEINRLSELLNKESLDENEKNEKGLILKKWKYEN